MVARVCRLPHLINWGHINWGQIPIVSLRILEAQNDRFEAQGWIERAQKRMLLRVICENGVVVTVITVMATSKFEKYGVIP